MFKKTLIFGLGVTFGYLVTTNHLLSRALTKVAEEIVEGDCDKPRLGLATLIKKKES